MPMLTTLRIGLPVCPFQSPLRTRLQKAAILSKTAWTPGITFSPSTMTDASRGARSAVCSTARSSVMLIFSPVNIASIRAGKSQDLAKSTSNPMVSDVMRFLE